MNDGQRVPKLVKTPVKLLAKYSLRCPSQLVSHVYTTLTYMFALAGGIFFGHEHICMSVFGGQHLSSEGGTTWTGRMNDICPKWTAGAEQEH